MLLQSPLMYELYHIDYSYKIEILYVYSKIVNRTWIIGIFMIIKWIYELLKIKTGLWFFIFQFIVGQFSETMAMLDNFMGHVGRSRIAGSVDSVTGGYYVKKS